MNTANTFTGFRDQMNVVI